MCTVRRGGKRSVEVSFSPPQKAGRAAAADPFVRWKETAKKGGWDVEEQGGEGETDSILTDLLIPAICFGAPSFFLPPVPSSAHINAEG